MVSEAVEPGLRYVPMSWEEYVTLPEGTRAEWVDGVAVVSPPPVAGHWRAQTRLAGLLEASLPGLDVVGEVAVRLSRDRVRVPDLSASSDRMAEDDWMRPAAPVLVVEVLSPSTRREDLLRKAPEYLEAGISQFWVVDRQARTIEVLRNGAERWETVAVVDDANPSADVPVGEWGTVPLELSAVLGDAGDRGERS